MEEEILEAVSRNDEAYEGDALEDISWEENLDIHRPNTATIADDHDDGVRKKCVFAEYASWHLYQIDAKVSSKMFKKIKKFL